MNFWWEKIKLYCVSVLCLISYTVGFCLASPVDNIAKHNWYPQVYQIAIMAPLTSTSKAFGIPQLQGVTLALDEYNFSRPSGSPEISLQIIDDQASPERGERAIREIFDSGTLAVIGPANSSVAKRVAATIKRDKLEIASVSPLATETSLTEQNGSEYFFRANVSDKKRLASMMSKLFSDNELRPSRFIIFYEANDAYGEGMLADTKYWLQKHHQEMLKDTYLQPYDRNIKISEAFGIINDISSKYEFRERDAVLLLGIAPDAITIIDALRRRQVESTLYFNEPDHNAFKAAAARGVKVGGVRVVSVFWPDNARINGFVDLYKNKFAEPPPFSAALSYDAARIVIKAIEAANKERPENEDLINFRRRVKIKITDPINVVQNFAVSGDHRFEKNEYVSLDFDGLKYNNNAELIQWNAPEDKLTAATKEQDNQPEAVEKQIAVPNLIMLAVVAFAGYVGSLMRQIKSSSASNFKDFIEIAYSPMAIIIDPLIAIMVACAMFVLVMFTKTDLLYLRDNAHSVYLISAIAVGAFAGASGYSSIDKVLSYLKLNKEGNEGSKNNRNPPP